eukprot:PhF_6_TR25733/c0_g1_i1/m.36268
MQCNLTCALGWKCCVDVNASVMTWCCEDPTRFKPSSPSTSSTSSGMDSSHTTIIIIVVVICIGACSLAGVFARVLCKGLQQDQQVQRKHMHRKSVQRLSHSEMTSLSPRLKIKQDDGQSSNCGDSKLLSASKYSVASSRHTPSPTSSDLPGEIIDEENENKTDSKGGGVVEGLAGAAEGQNMPLGVEGFQLVCDEPPPPPPTSEGAEQ